MKLFKKLLRINELVLTKTELYSLLSPYWRLTSDKKLERDVLIKRIGWGLLGAFVSIMGWLHAPVVLLSSIIPPMHMGSYILAGFGLVYILILLSPISERCMKFLNLKINTILCAVMLIIAAVYILPFGIPAMRAERERSIVAKMNDDEKYWYEQKIKRQAELKEVELQKVRDDEERVRIEEMNKGLEAARLSSAREREERYKREAEVENARQREFYAEMGAPKLLYRCKGDYVEKAIGAKIGGINSLISRAQFDCALGYETIKRKD